MAKKAHILFLFLTLGFFLQSGTGYACGKSSEKNSCEKKVTSTKTNSDSCQKDCCKKDQHGCNGKCDHSGCTVSGLQFSLISENEFDFNSNTFNFSLEKPTVYYTETSVSDGFTSIWLPPKIKELYSV